MAAAMAGSVGERRSIFSSRSPVTADRMLTRCCGRHDVGVVRAMPARRLHTHQVLSLPPCLLALVTCVGGPMRCSKAVCGCSFHDRSPMQVIQRSSSAACSMRPSRIFSGHTFHDAHALGPHST